MKIEYEDNHIIVVYKEDLELSQPDGTDKISCYDLVKNYIKNKYNKPGNVFLGIVHRLDYNTKGYLVFAKTSKAAKRLSEEFSSKKNIVKKYLVCAENKLKNDIGILKDKLIKNEIEKKSYVSSNGKEAILEYKFINSFDNKYYYDVKLITGRHHQIRVQFSNQNAPLYGDIKYGSKNKYISSFLQEYYLSFIHPVKKEILIFKKISIDGIFNDILINNIID